MQVKPDEIIVLLRRLMRGDEAAANELLRVVCEELRRIARVWLCVELSLKGAA